MEKIRGERFRGQMSRDETATLYYRWRGKWIRHLGNAGALMLAIEADATVSHRYIKIHGCGIKSQRWLVNSTLTRFAAWYCNSGRQGGIENARCLETSTTLTHLGLVNKTVVDAGAEVLQG